MGAKSIKTRFSVILLICLISSVLLSCADVKAAGFGDVSDPSEPYYNPVYWAVGEGIVKGYKNGNFGPQDSCTREQFVVMIWRLAGKPLADSDVSFSDINDTMTTYKAIQWAVDRGIIKGFSDGSFGPEQTVTRRQAVVMLWRMAGNKTAAENINFSDLDPSETTYKAIQWGAAAGIVKGYSDGTFGPDENCLRCHIVIFLYRYAKKIMNKDVDVVDPPPPSDVGKHARLLYMGHASIRITTEEGKVIYIDPYAGKGYDPAADLILATHAHVDHSSLDKVANRNPDCQIITWKEALTGGEHRTFDLGYAKVEAVEAGFNSGHDVNSCVGYIITLSGGITVYVTGDTSKTDQMPLLAERNIDYAFYCCDGVYNMDLDEAAECAKLVNAKHNIPYHMIVPSKGLFDRERAMQFDAPGRMIISDGEEIELVKE